MIDAHMVRAFALSGEQVLCAYEADHAGDPDHVVGASVAWFGRDAEGEHLHSHITGVDPGLQGRSIGYALKLHQRAWALERGIATVRWTFDPLLRRNAFFNLCKLGAFADRYHVDLYGAMTDATNAGDESDRFAVCWSLTDARATRAAAGSEIEPDIESLAASGASVILDEGSGGRPIASPPSGGVLLARVPAEMTRMRIEEPALAREWRAAARCARRRVRRRVRGDRDHTQWLVRARTG
ncbi:MAG: GNAT family N-acetyltransferase [Acidimicrobiia bacterium]|nr:GNAT family N-acetyltransferase [Acidimicrobiia bacterium]